MKMISMAIVCLCMMLSSGEPSNINMQIDRTLTVDSLGACQGISYQKGRLFLYGDREFGMIREYALSGDS
jgi:hypothetical protein